MGICECNCTPFIYRPAYSNQQAVWASKKSFIIVDGIIWVKGGLGHTSLFFETKHPIFLPKFYFGKLCVIHYHELCLHNRLKKILNKFRIKYWISKVRNFIQQIIGADTKCKIQGRTYNYSRNQHDWPYSRVLTTFLFTLRSVDYADPPTCL